MFQVAGIQMRPIMNNVEANLKRGINYIYKAVEQQEVDLIVFPEMWTTGYHLSRETFLALGESRYGQTVSTIREEAKKVNTAIICPFIEKTEMDDLYISAAVIDNEGELRGIVRKSVLWGRENNIFKPGNIEYPVFDIKAGKIGILMCYEMEFPETSRLLALEGAEVIVCPSVWSIAASRRWDIQLPARSLDNTVFVFGINTVGNNSCGKSKLVSPLGDILIEASDTEEEIITHIIDKEVLLWAREEVPYLDDFKDKLTPGGINKIKCPVI
ncbi:nitrilase-related carbon-nitrogen hydrolase [Serpentinicella sp. ANB-PHB4]|uniref:nitrilase-related carbon-nitrogen hydrolase n=1 Tax=Serpentinicella sp. ANB-PHB4 TaxID=3074076 RepID=UPI002858B9B5|nr:nitrilase-related carbon-nitrogen hydrolase [Serpentinicella sp. ANB-PHB4]MDR5658509.1 nitrilase-related carbon-nitrogen hydrolase [Serpentinicella sp. ANB-PHB4]